MKSSVSVAVNKKLITLDNDIKHNSRYEPVRNRSINTQPGASAGKRRLSQFLTGWKTTPLFLIGWSMLHVSFFCLFVESRYVLLPMVVEQLKNEMKKTEEMRRCIDILNDILITLTRKDVVS